MSAGRHYLLAAFLGAVVMTVGVLAVTPARAIEITPVTSEKGITAWLIQDQTVPLVSMEFAFRGGAALDPKGKAGLAEMATSLLDEGAGDLDSAAFQKRLSEQSIRLRFSAGLDSVSGSLRALNENRAEAFELLSLALTVPRFDAEPVARVRSQMLAAQRREAERPRSIAERRWHGTVFEGHPYARDVDGNKETIPTITPDDLRAWIGRQFARENLLVGVVGDITPEELKSLLDRAFGDLPAKAQTGEVTEAPIKAAGKTLVVRRDIPQTVVMFGHKGISIQDPDYYAAAVMNYIMGGGGLTSRLAEEVREKRGLAYSVYTRLVTYDHAPVILGWVATQNARVKESMDLIRAEWQRMAADGVTAAELEDAKNYLMGSYYTRLGSTGRIAGTLVGIQLERLGIDYFDRRNDLIAAVTVDDVARVARRLLAPGALTVVMVGDPEGVTSDL